VLVIIAAADLGNSIQLSADGESIPSANFYSPIIKIATFVSILALFFSLDHINFC